MPVIFQDFSVQVKGALSSAVDQYLEEAASEIESAARRDSRVDSGQLKDSWNHIVDSPKQKATIGSPLENAIWEEFGTGEYASEGGHGGGYWVFVKGGSSGGDKHVTKRYTLKKAKQIVAMMRAEGLDAYYTKGKRPNRTLHTAYEKNKTKIIRRAEQIFGERMK